MRFFKSIILIATLTVIALIYVHQQVELVKLSYAIECKEKALKDMLDHRENLGYNISNLETPSRLEKVLLSQNIDITFPKRNNVVKTAKIASDVRGEERIRASLGVEGKVNNMLRIFEFLSPRAEAQAKEK